MTRERSIFKNSFSCFMTDRSATEQEVNNILSHDISHDLKSLKCFKFIQFSDICLEEIHHIEKSSIFISMDTTALQMSHLQYSF